jgi:hypothetical protein
MVQSYAVALIVDTINDDDAASVYALYIVVDISQYILYSASSMLTKI